MKAMSRILNIFKGFFSFFKPWSVSDFVVALDLILILHGKCHLQIVWIWAEATYDHFSTNAFRKGITLLLFTLLTYYQILWQNISCNDNWREAVNIYLGKLIFHKYITCTPSSIKKGINFIVSSWQCPIMITVLLHICCYFCEHSSALRSVMCTCKAFWHLESFF